VEYADVLWDSCSISKRDLLEHIQYEAAKVTAMKGTSKSRVLEELAWEDM
jgi:hypothetical protein